MYLMKKKESVTMGVIRLYPECIKCLLNKQLDKCPENAPLEKKVEYMQKVLQIVAKAPLYESAPVLVRGMYDLQEEIFGISTDFTKIKSYFNCLMLGLEERLWEEIMHSERPLKLAIQYAMIGNYIDFAALKDVDEKTLRTFLDKAQEENVDEEELSNLQRELEKGGELVYLLDNCGEIVTDKLLMRLIKENYPDIHITAMVRGGQIMNDVTLEDAKEVELDKIASVIDSGSNIAGISLEKISEKARKAIVNADLIIAKGQGNFETLHQCGENIYYIFMCKCTMFTKRFSLPQFSGVLVNEKNI